MTTPIYIPIPNVKKIDKTHYTQILYDRNQYKIESFYDKNLEKDIYELTFKNKKLKMDPFYEDALNLYFNLYGFFYIYDSKININVNNKEK